MKKRGSFLGMTMAVLSLMLLACEPQASPEQPREQAKPGSAMANVMIDSVNYRHDRGIRYTLYDTSGGAKKTVGGSHVSRLAGGGSKDCCLALPKIWHPGIKVEVEWGEADTEQIFPETYVKELEIPRYERPADLYVVFYPKHEVEVVVSSAEPGHPEWAGREKQTPWNVCVAEHGRKVCKRAIPHAGLDLNEMQGYCTYLKEEGFELSTCKTALHQCIENYEDEKLCKRTLWGERKK